MVTTIANYLHVNVYQLFCQASEWQDEGLNREMVQEAYDRFITDQTVADFVYEYCELIAESMG